MRSVYFTPQGLAGILCSRAGVCLLLGQGERALADLDRAWGLAGGVRQAERRQRLQLACLQGRIRVLSLLSDYAGMRAAAEEALEVSRSLRDRKREGDALNELGRVQHFQGEHEPALGFYRRSLAIRQEVGDRVGEAVNLNNMGLIYNTWEEKLQVLDHHHRSLAIDQEIGDRQGEAYDQTNIGYVLLEMGNHPESERVYQKGEDLTKEIGDRELGGEVLAGLAALYLDQDRLRLAEEKIRQMGDLAGALNSKKHLGVVLYLQGRLHIKRGMGDLARAAFQESIAIFKENKNKLELGKACYYFAQGLKELGDRSESQRYGVQAKEIFQRLKARGWLKKLGASEP